MLRNALLRLPWSWHLIEVEHAGILIVRNRRGQQFQHVLSAYTFIHVACTIHNFKRNGFQFALTPVTVLKTSANEDASRQLRVWFHMFKHQIV